MFRSAAVRAILQAIGGFLCVSVLVVAGSYRAINSWMNIPPPPSPKPPATQPFIPSIWSLHINYPHFIFDMDRDRIVEKYELPVYFDYFNKNFFGGRVPQTDFVCSPSPRYVHSAYALTYYSSSIRLIMIDSQICAQGVKVYAPILLHEMVHAEMRDDKENHGENFKRELQRVIRSGALDEVLD